MRWSVGRPFRPGTYGLVIEVKKFLNLCVQDVVNIVKNSEDCCMSAIKVRDHAFLCHSTDNISVLVVGGWPPSL